MSQTCSTLIKRGKKGKKKGYVEEKKGIKWEGKKGRKKGTDEGKKGIKWERKERKKIGYR